MLLLNRSEVQSEFLSIAEKLSGTEPPRHAALILLLEHLYQVTFGTRCDLGSLRCLLKVGTAFPFSSRVWALVLCPQLETGKAPCCETAKKCRLIPGTLCSGVCGG